MGGSARARVPALTDEFILTYTRTAASQRMVLLISILNLAQFGRIQRPFDAARAPRSNMYRGLSACTLVISTHDSDTARAVSDRQHVRGDDAEPFSGSALLGSMANAVPLARAVRRRRWTERPDACTSVEVVSHCGKISRKKPYLHTLREHSSNFTRGTERRGWTARRRSGPPITTHLFRRYPVVQSAVVVTPCSYPVAVVDW